MEQGLLVTGWICTGLLGLLAISFLITSLREREWRAMGVTVLLAGPLVGALLVLMLVDFPGRSWTLLGVAALVAVACLVLIIPVSSEKLRITGVQERIDERDAFFHRFYRLQPGTAEFEAYYRDHPEKAKTDEKTRSLPPLGGPGSKAYHPLSSQYQRATFEVLEGITRDVEWEPVEMPDRAANAEELTRRIKGFAKYLGASLVGCTRLNPAHVYSHIGRSPGEWGEVIDLGHTHAVAIAVEMSHEMIRLAPDSPATTETARQYFEAAKIATLVARTINLFGYQARAHVDGNYRVMCVPVAADAGLGELGRIGLLITPQYGPRVRLAVVTTDLPLVQDPPVAFGVQHFCELCKKCADLCPSGSIAQGSREVFAGVEKWQSKQDGCYRFWRIQGSDCSICIRVCPYSHPNTAMHCLVRWLARRNGISRRVMLKGDDWFYGRKPSPGSGYPHWHAMK